jgi:hypothetical protein
MQHYQAGGNCGVIRDTRGTLCVADVSSRRVYRGSSAVIPLERGLELRGCRSGEVLSAVRCVYMRE